MLCEECKNKIKTFLYNMDEYVYRRGDKIFCGWTCLRKYEKKQKQELGTPCMEWEKTASNTWTAAGDNGMFTIERTGRIYKARYTSSKYNTKLKFRPTRKLSESQKLCEENEYWEW